MQNDLQLTIEPMDERSARTICGWRYPGEYAYYDVVGGASPENLADMLDGSQYTVTDATGVLIAFLAFGDVAQVPGGVAQGLYGDTDLLDFGIGLRPDLTGRGLGLAVVQAGLAFARAALGARGFRLSVAAFNRRAIRVYERAGFVAGETFTSISARGVTDFLLMRLPPTGN